MEAFGIDWKSVDLGSMPDVAAVSKGAYVRPDRLPPPAAEPSLVAVPRTSPVSGLDLYALVRDAANWQQLPSDACFKLQITRLGE